MLVYRIYRIIIKFFFIHNPFISNIMPELPEVETFKRYLDKTSLKQLIKKVKVIDDRILKVDDPYLRESDYQSASEWPGPNHSTKSPFHPLENKIRSTYTQILPHRSEHKIHVRILWG